MWIETYSSDGSISVSVAKLRRFRSLRLRPPSLFGSPIKRSATPPSFISPITCSTRAAYRKGIVNDEASARLFKHLLVKQIHANKY